MYLTNSFTCIYTGTRHYNVQLHLYTGTHSGFTMLWRQHLLTYSLHVFGYTHTVGHDNDPFLLPPFPPPPPPLTEKIAPQLTDRPSTVTLAAHARRGLTIGIGIAPVKLLAKPLRGVSKCRREAVLSDAARTEGKPSYFPPSCVIITAYISTYAMTSLRSQNVS